MIKYVFYAFLLSSCTTLPKGTKPLGKIVNKDLSKRKHEFEEKPIYQKISLHPRIDDQSILYGEQDIYIKVDSEKINIKDLYNNLRKQNVLSK